MSKNLTGLYKQQEIQGTKTLSAPLDSDYAKNFSTTAYAMPQSFKVPPIRTAVVPSKYEDGPAAKPKSFPLVANGKPSADSPKKQAEKRKFDEDTKKKAADDDDDDVDLTESENDDDDDDDDDVDDKKKVEGDNDDDDDDNEEDTEDDEDMKAAQKIMLEESKRAMATGNKNEALLVHRIKENKRASRPEKLCDISGSSNADEEDDDDEDEVDEDSNGIERVRNEKTPIEHLLGEATLVKIKHYMKQINNDFAELNTETIWSLNSLILNLITVKFPHMALRLTGKTNDSFSSKPENSRRCLELAKNDPEKLDVAKGFIGTQYYPLAMAIRFSLPTAVVVKPISSSETLCAIEFDPFRTAQLKAFGDAAIEQKIFPKSSNIPPISMRRYAILNGKTQMTKANLQMLVDESSMHAHETDVSQQQQQQHKSNGTTADSFPATPISETKKAPARESFTFDSWRDGELATFASDKNLLVNDVSSIIRESNVNMVIVPNDVLGALLHRRTVQRLGRLALLPVALEDDDKSFVSFLKLASFPRSAASDAKIDAYISSGNLIKLQRDLTYTHLLFGFVRMNTQLNEYEESRGKCVMENLRVQTHSRLGVDTTAGIHLALNETPIRSLLRLNHNIVKLLSQLWKEYLETMHIDGKLKFYEKRAEWASKQHVEAAIQYVLSGDYETQKSFIAEWSQTTAPLPDEWFVHDSLLYSTMVLLPSA